MTNNNDSVSNTNVSVDDADKVARKEAKKAAKKAAKQAAKQAAKKAAKKTIATTKAKTPTAKTTSVKKASEKTSVVKKSSTKSSVKKHGADKKDTIKKREAAAKLKKREAEKKIAAKKKITQKKAIEKARLLEKKAAAKKRIDDAKIAQREADKKATAKKREIAKVIAQRDREKKAVQAERVKTAKARKRASDLEKERAKKAKITAKKIRDREKARVVADETKERNKVKREAKRARDKIKREQATEKAKVTRRREILKAKLAKSIAKKQEARAAKKVYDAIKLPKKKMTKWLAFGVQYSHLVDEEKRKDMEHRSPALKELFANRTTEQDANLDRIVAADAVRYENEIANMTPEMVAKIETMRKAKRKENSASRKIKLEAGKPAAHLSAYLLFSEDRRAALTELFKTYTVPQAVAALGLDANSDDEKMRERYKTFVDYFSVTKTIKFKDVATALGIEWALLSDEERDVYSQKSAALKEKYMEELEIFEKNHPEHARTKKKKEIKAAARLANGDVDFAPVKDRTASTASTASKSSKRSLRSRVAPAE